MNTRYAPVPINLFPYFTSLPLFSAPIQPSFPLFLQSAPYRIAELGQYFCSGYFLREESIRLCRWKTPGSQSASRRPKMFTSLVYRSSSGPRLDACRLDSGNSRSHGGVGPFCTAIGSSQLPISWRMGRSLFASIPSLLRLLIAVGEVVRLEKEHCLRRHRSEYDHSNYRPSECPSKSVI
jgi:hypothetical protein